MRRYMKEDFEDEFEDKEYFENPYEDADIRYGFIVSNMYRDEEYVVYFKDGRTAEKTLKKVHRVNDSWEKHHDTDRWYDEMVEVFTAADGYAIAYDNKFFTDDIYGEALFEIGYDSFVTPFDGSNKWTTVRVESAYSVLADAL